MSKFWKIGLIWLSLFLSVLLVWFIRERSRKIDSITWAETRIEKLASIRDSLTKYDQRRQQGYETAIQNDSIYQFYAIQHDSVAALIRDHGPGAANARDSIRTRIQRSIQQRLP